MAPKETFWFWNLPVHVYYYYSQLISIISLLFTIIIIVIIIIILLIIIIIIIITIIIIMIIIIIIEIIAIFEQVFILGVLVALEQECFQSWLNFVSVLVSSRAYGLG